MSRLPFVDAWIQSYSASPAFFFTQVALFFVALILVFLVFFTTRDVLIRSRSFLFQLFSIVLVAALPILGFLIYLLIRPASTVRERALEANVSEIIEMLQKHKQGSSSHKQQSHSFKMQPAKHAKAA